MTRLSSIVLFALAGGVLLSVSAGDDEVVFRSDVSLVRVDAQVVDRGNRAITGLSATDFVLREEGRPQPIRNFASENMPMDVLFLLDVSASMRPHVQRIADAAHEALRVLRDEDRMGIMVFDRSSRLRLPFRNSRAQVERGFNDLLDQETFGGGTDITRGLYDAASYVERAGRRDARRAIVILTDDETQLNRDVEGVSRALTRADAVLCALIAPDAMGTGRMGGRGPQQGGGYPGGGYPGGGYPGGGSWPGGSPGGIILGRPRGPYGNRGPGTMRMPRTHSAGTAEIAQRSGGDSMPVDNAFALQDTLARLRQRYALYFYLPEGVKPGQERAIEVSLADAAIRRYPGADVRYRRVYLAPDGKGGTAPSGSEPTTVMRTPSGDSSSTSAATVAGDGSSSARRRPVVSDATATRQGPLSIDGSPAASSSTNAVGAQSQTPSDSDGPWRRTGQPAGKSTPADNAQTNDEPSQGGWRRAKPEDLK